MTSPINRLDEARAGNYDINLGRIIGEGWEKQSGFRGAFWGALLLAALIVFVISLIGQLLLGIITGLSPNAAIIIILSIFFQIIKTYIDLSMRAGITIMGIHRASDQSFSYKYIFNYFRLGVRIFFLNLLIGIIIFLFALITYGGILAIGFSHDNILLVIVGSILIIIGIALIVWFIVGIAFSTALIVDKNLKIWEAITTSIQAVSKNWFRICGYLIVLGLIGTAGAILLLIGLIWTLPWVNVSMGVLYRDIFGVEQVEGEKPDAINDSENTTTQTEAGGQTDS